MQKKGEHVLGHRPFSFLSLVLPEHARCRVRGCLNCWFDFLLNGTRGAETPLDDLIFFSETAKATILRAENICGSESIKEHVWRRITPRHLHYVHFSFQK